jgi:hypothetical protein
VTRLNALSKAFGDSLASTSRAIATYRLWRSASVSLGFAAFFAICLVLIPVHVVYAADIRMRGVWTNT